jgi:hypothetical protein
MGIPVDVTRFVVSVTELSCKSECKKNISVQSLRSCFLGRFRWFLVASIIREFRCRGSQGLTSECMENRSRQHTNRIGVACLGVHSWSQLRSRNRSQDILAIFFQKFEKRYAIHSIHRIGCEAYESFLVSQVTLVSRTELLGV